METETLHTKVKLGHMWINDDLDDIKCPAAQGIHIETASSKRLTGLERLDLSFCNSGCIYKIEVRNIMWHDLSWCSQIWRNEFSDPVISDLIKHVSILARSKWCAPHF